MHYKLCLAAVLISIIFTKIVIAEEGAAIYKANCSMCHGAKGEGMKILAPPLKGNEFIIKGTIMDIKRLILEGRDKTMKKYKEEYPVMGMPKVPVKEDEMDILINFLQNDLQK